MARIPSVAKAYDAVAESYAAENWKTRPSLPSLKRFAASLPAKASILDVGSGAGQDSHYFRGRGFQVTGIEPSRQLLKIARQKVPGAKFINADLDHAVLRAGIFDAAWCNRVFQHVSLKDQERFLKKVRRSLRSGGRFYLSLKIAPRRSHETVKKEGRLRFPVVHTTFKRIGSLLRRSGFDVEKKADWGVARMWEFYCVAR